MSPTDFAYVLVKVMLLKFLNQAVNNSINSLKIFIYRWIFDLCEIKIIFSGLTLDKNQLSLNK